MSQTIRPNLTPDSDDNHTDNLISRKTSHDSNQFQQIPTLGQFDHDPDSAAATGWVAVPNSQSDTDDEDENLFNQQNSVPIKSGLLGDDSDDDGETDFTARLKNNFTTDSENEENNLVDSLHQETLKRVPVIGDSIEEDNSQPELAKDPNNKNEEDEDIPIDSEGEEDDLNIPVDEEEEQQKDSDSNKRKTSEENDEVTPTKKLKLNDNHSTASENEEFTSRINGVLNSASPVRSRTTSLSNSKPLPKKAAAGLPRLPSINKSGNPSTPKAGILKKKLSVDSNSEQPEIRSPTIQLNGISDSSTSNPASQNQTPKLVKISKDGSKIIPVVVENGKVKKLETPKTPGTTDPLMIQLKVHAKKYHDSISKFQPAWRRFDSLKELKNIYSLLSNDSLFCDARKLASLQLRSPKKPETKIRVYEYIQAINDMFVNTCVKQKQVSFIDQCVKTCVKLGLALRFQSLVRSVKQDLAET